VHIVPQEDIHTIQLSQGKCTITLKTEEAKNAVRISGIDIGINHVRIYEIERSLTSVTIKDSPAEMRDECIVAVLSVYMVMLYLAVSRQEQSETQIFTLEYAT
jgi:hypothetical protein